MPCHCPDFSSPLSSFVDVESRCLGAALIASTLAPVATNSDTWMSVLRCKVCGKLWAREYPFSEHHGGGAPCYYQLASDDPTVWLASASPVTSALRQEHEDVAFLQRPGPEQGPESCRDNGYRRLRIGHSVFCREHHFHNIFGRGPVTRSVNERPPTRVFKGL